MRLMNPVTDQPAVQPEIVRKVRRIGCVSYLNARPLIEGIDDHGAAIVSRDVPSRLLHGLASGETDIALCPVIDYYRSDVPLDVVPVGGISSRGHTLTVRLCSRIPVNKISVIHVDSESHTSVALLRVLMDQMYGLRPRLAEYDAIKRQTPAEAVLLIGDKVITRAPDDRTYPHQLDLGEAWSFLTGLPFVFAVWMARRDTDLGDLPTVLGAQLRLNLDQLDSIADRYARSHDWPEDLAREYLGQIMSYTVGPAELEAIERFAEAASSLGIIPPLRPLRLRQ